MARRSGGSSSTATTAAGGGGNKNTRNPSGTSNQSASSSSPVPGSAAGGAANIPAASTSSSGNFNNTSSTMHNKSAAVTNVPGIGRHPFKNAGNNAGLDAGWWTSLLARGYTARYVGFNLKSPSSTPSNAAVPLSSSMAAATTTGGAHKFSAGAATTTSSPTTSSASWGIHILSNEEIEKDLRHMAAYHEASVRYHQQYYAAVNRVMPTVSAASVAGDELVPAAGGGAPPLSSMGPAGLLDGSAPGVALAATTALPIRIDPEEEKRQALQRKRMAKAEAVREELEQSYVANRAHYVLASQQLQQATQSAQQQIAFMQNTVQHSAQLMAWQRCRLHMTRMVARMLRHRKQVLVRAALAEVQPNFNQDKMDSQNDDAMVPSQVLALAEGIVSSWQQQYAIGGSSEPAQEALVQIWTQAEEQIKKLVQTPVAWPTTASSPNPSPVGASEETASAAGASKRSTKRQSAGSNPVIVPWNCITQPPTPRGVSLMVSAAVVSNNHHQNGVPAEEPTSATGTMTAVPPTASSKLMTKNPEKTVAWSAQGMWGSYPHGWVWTGQDHVPPVILSTNPQDPTGPRVVQESWLQKQVSTLKDEAAMLQAELESERQSNQKFLHLTGQARQQHDQWIAMVALVRQETEAILHRHNILLESDLAMAAADQWAQQHQEDQPALQSQAKDAGQVTSSGEHETSTEPAGESSKEGGSVGLTASGGDAAPMEELDDEAHDGDDEGDEEEDDDGWGGGAKRASEGGAEDTSASARSRKRPKT